MKAIMFKAEYHEMRLGLYMHIEMHYATVAQIPQSLASTAL